MKQQGYIPANILCSTALRARQTIQLVSSQLGIDESEISYQPDLYLATRKTLLSTIAAHRAETGPLMLVGHNPGLDEVVRYICVQPVPLTEKGKLMTTGCLARFSLPANAGDLREQAELLSITRPSEI